MFREVPIFDVLHETLVKLHGNGILLVAGDPPNPMTIGWGMVGPVWNRQVFSVLVRPTRHSFQLMEKSQDFSICVLPDGYSRELAFCGSRSGRDTDKVKECSFSMARCTVADAWYISESEFVFECRTIHRHRLDPDALDPAINRRFYPKPDHHMVYYGEILRVCARTGSDSGV